MTTRILISAAMLASFAMLATEGEAQQPQTPKPSAPQVAPKGTPAPQAAPAAKGAAAAPAGAPADQPQPVDEATRKRQAALERAKERKREQQEREAQCVIKPVMSDEEIAKCRAVRRGG
ncbi:MAG TPA: hypothetical protein VL180_07265 [Burkholderiales bacterium]|nr:hypothetical protein [Burkholderiales bacterium]